MRATLHRALVAWAILGGGTALAQTVVDDFGTAQAPLFSPPVPAASIISGAGILGVERDLRLERTAGAGNVSAQVVASSLTFTADAGTTGELLVTWDGADADALNLAPAGLAGLDLIAGGQGALRIRLRAPLASASLVVEVWSDALRSSRTALVLPAVAAPTDFVLPFESFVANLGSGADFSSVGAITLFLRGTALTVEVLEIATASVSTLVAAPATDGVTAANPGDTLEYVLTLGSIGQRAAQGTALTSTLDANTSLVAGSIEVSPLARDDFYGGALRGAPFTTAAPGLLANDVDGNGDPLTAKPNTPITTEQGGSATVLSDGGFSYTPAPGFRGVDAFAYQADDGKGILGDGRVTLVVSCPVLGVTPTTLTDAVTGLLYPPVAFAAANAEGTVTWTQAGALPGGMNFSAAGVLDGTPTQSGSFPFTVTATDAGGCRGTLAVTLTVGCAAIVVTNPVNATAVRGVPFSETFTQTGAVGSATFTLASGVLPANLNLSAAGVLSGTPVVSGSFPITVRVTDANTCSAVGVSYALVVNEAPAITSASNATFTVGTLGSFTVTTSGFPIPTITRAGATLPAAVTFVDNGDGTSTLTGTPGPGTGGTYAVSFTAANGVGADATQAFTLTVREAPAITSANAATFEVGVAGSFTVTTTGFPAPTLTRGGVLLPTGVTFLDNGDGTGTLAGTPAAGTGGTYAITFTAQNVVGTTPAQAFTLTVNQAPAITSGNAATFEVGVAGSFTVTATGFPTPSLTRGGVALPAGVTFLDNGNGTGTLAGMPGALTGGTYAISFTAQNVVGTTAAQAFILTVNQAPAITSASAVSFAVGVPGTFTVTATGFPTPAITRSALAALPNLVTYVDNGNGTGTLSGTPAAATGGAFAFTLTATNGVGAPAGQPFTLTVNQPPAITSASTATFTVGQANSFTVTTSGFPVPTTIGQTGALPTGVGFTNNGNGTATLAGTPAASTAGVYPLGLSASNGIPPDAAQSFTLTAACPTITVTPATLPDAVYNVVYNATGVQFAQTGGNGAITWSASGLPSGLTLGATGLLSGTPTTTGTFTVSVTATDAFACSGTRAGVALVARPRAVGDGYAAVGNTQLVAAGHSAPTTPFAVNAASILANDEGPAGTLAVTPVTGAATALGGSITLNAAGAFIYTPALGVTGADSYVYTVTSNGVSATATIVLTLNNVVWYVNGSGANGDGRSQSPFNNLGAAQTASLAGHYVFVHSAGSPYAAGFVLKANQTLWGQGTAFTLGPLTIAATTKPGLTNTVTLATGSTVSSLDVNATTTTGMLGNGLTGVTVSNAVSVTTTTGTAVSLTNVNDSTFTFRSIASNGAASGISLTNVNTTTGAFTVAGTGAPASGGTIQNATGAGVSLSNVKGVSLSSMSIQNTVLSGVRGTLVTDFAFLNGAIANSGTGSGAGESNIAFNVDTAASNVSGVLTITGSTLTNGFTHGVAVDNGAGTLSNVTISGNTVTSATSTATSKGDGIHLVGVGSAGVVASVTKAAINGNVISNFPSGAGIQVSGGNSTSAAAPIATFGNPGNATNIIDITGNRVAGQSIANRLGTSAIIAVVSGHGQGNFNISNNGTALNPLTNVTGTAILVGINGTSTATVVTSNNVIVANNTVASNGIGGGTGVTFGTTDTADLTWTINGNNISGVDGNGILAVARGATGNLKLRLQNNVVAAPLTGVRQGIRVDAGNGTSVNDKVCVDLTGNTSAPSVGQPAALGIGLRRQAAPGTNAFGVVGMAATATPGVETFVSGLNPAGGGTLLLSATSGFTSCVLP